MCRCKALFFLKAPVTGNPAVPVASLLLMLFRGLHLEAARKQPALAASEANKGVPVNLPSVPFSAAIKDLMSPMKGAEECFPPRIPVQICYCFFSFPFPDPQGITVLQL